MLALAFVWLALLVVELISGESLLFEIIGTIVWVIFILDFAVEFVLASSNSSADRRRTSLPNRHRFHWRSGKAPSQAKSWKSMSRSSQPRLRTTILMVRDANARESRPDV